MSAAPPPLFPNIELSALFPAYNEEGNIERTIPRAVEELRRMVGKFEVILIDDCSTDRTLEIAHELAAKYPEIRVLKNDVNMRQGGTLARGFKLTKYEWVTHNAVDYPFHFEDLPLLLTHTRDADVIIASRRTYPGTTRLRRFVSWTNRAMIRMIFNMQFNDYSYVQIFRRSVLENQETFSTSTGFIMPEKIIRAHRDGLHVVEVELEYHRREAGVSSSANTKNIIESLEDMFRLRMELFRKKKKRG